MSQAVPEVTLTITDRNLGILANPIENIHLKIGVCELGTNGTIYSFNDKDDVKAVLGSGPLAKAVAYSLATDTQGLIGRPCYAVRINPSVAGIFSTVQKTAVSGGTGTGTVTVAQTASTIGPFDRYEVIVEITRTGTVAVGAYRYSLDGGTTYSVELTIPNTTYAIPDTGMTLTFVVGGGPVFFEDGDLHVFKTRAPHYSTDDLLTAVTSIFASPLTWECIDLVGPAIPTLSAVTETGTTPPDLTVAGTPVDYYDAIVDIVLGGVLETATFRYSLDGGTTYSSTITTPAATYLIPNTGITITFTAGTYNADNIYTFNSGNAAGMRTFADALSTHMTTALTKNRFVFSNVEAPDDTKTRLIAAMASFADYRVTYSGGYAKIADILTANIVKRSASWVINTRIAAVKPSRSPARFDSGPLKNVTSILHDENVSPQLSAQRFQTLRTHLDVQGFFVTKDPTGAPTGSDFTYLANLRVINNASRALRLAQLKFLEEDLPVDAVTGKITEIMARGIDSFCADAVKNALGDNIVTAQVITNRTDNLLVTMTLKCRLIVTPRGRVGSIETTVGLGLQLPTNGA